MRDPLPLSVDPIGDFLRQHGEDDDPSRGPSQVRLRLERFRRDFPGLPLPNLAGPQLHEHLMSLQRQGAPPAELEATRQICQEFLSFTKGEAVELLSPRVETRRDVPYALSRTPSPAPRAEPTYRSSSSGSGKMLLLLLIAAVAGSAFAWKHYTANTVRPATSR